jgi:spoIIIJ-associated protein
VQTAVGSGLTLEDAVKDALTRLGAAPEQVVLRKVEEGSAGLMGAAPRPYRVRATWKPEFAPPPVPEPEKKVYGMQPEHAAFSGDPGGSGEDRGPRGRDRGDRPGRGDRGGRSGGGDRGDRGGRGGRSDRPAWIDPEEGKAERLSRPARKSPPMSDEGRFVVDEAFMAQTRETATWLVRQMGFADATVTVTGSGDEVLVAYDDAENEDLLSGRRGETRMALQTVLSRMVNPKRGASANVMVDVNGYWQNRRDALLAQARDLADQAVATGEEMVTGPLAAEERRLVHRMLADDPRVATESFGEGATKRMSIRALDDVADGD